MQLKRFLIPVVILISVISSQAQVQAVKYLIKFDPSTCLYDACIYIESGQAVNHAHRILFGSGFHVVVPTGVLVSIAETHMPLIDNTDYDGTVPSTWTLGPSVYDVNGEGFDVHRLGNSLNPAARFNNLYAGDTVKLFSLEMTDVMNCGDGIRNYTNGVDPNNMNGGDWTNSWNMFFVDVYNGNLDEDLSDGPTVDLNSKDSIDVVEINIDVTSSACMGPITFEWSGPNGYTGSSEDVYISPATPADYGVYAVTVTDDMDCENIFEFSIYEEGGGPPPMQVLEITNTDLIITPTYEHIGVHLNIEGDDNKNSVFTVEYKLQGTNTYFPAAVSMRASPELIVDGNPLNKNFHAASAMHLLPNSYYDLKITLNDTDGGSTVLMETVQTEEFPGVADNNTSIYVSPGSGGGNGSVGNPYLGIQAAVNNAAPGQTILVSDGIYDVFTLEESGTKSSPIIIKSMNLHGAIINGQNTTSGIVTIGTFSDSIQHVILDGFDIRNGAWGVDAQNTQFLTVKNNKINDVDFGFYNRRENGWEHDQFIHNNEIIGRTTWPQLDGSIPSERGVDIRGNKNVISYNSISDFGDGVSTDGSPYMVSYGLDIHNNKINRVVDDLIEVDGSLSNTRVYKNQGFNGRMGVSLAPIYGGPAYVFQNQFYNLETSAFKMNRSPSGLVIVNNTIVKLDRGLTSDSGWQNTIFKNNAVVSSHYVVEEFGLVANSIDDWDNNGYYSVRSGTSSQPWFKFDNIQYSDVQMVNLSGVLEGDGMEISMSDFVDVTLPNTYGTEALFSSVDVFPSINSDLIDQGSVLDNILGDDVKGIGPEIGALEFNGITPDYGHNFMEVCEEETILKTWNGSRNIGWFDPYNWTPCGVPTKENDVVIPGGLLYYPRTNSDVSVRNLSILEGGTMTTMENIEVRLHTQQP